MFNSATNIEDAPVGGLLQRQVREKMKARFHGV